MAAEAWPSMRGTAFTLAPELTASEAAVCRSSRGVSPFRPTALAASSIRNFLVECCDVGDGQLRPVGAEPQRPGLH